MGFVLLGLLLVAAKLLGLRPVQAWSWWVVGAPFVAALVWWYVADVTGLTKRRETLAEARRAEAKRRRRFENLGMKPDVDPRTGRRTPGRTGAARRPAESDLRSSLQQAGLPEGSRHESKF